MRKGTTIMGTILSKQFLLFWPVELGVLSWYWTYLLWSLWFDWLAHLQDRTRFVLFHPVSNEIGRFFSGFREGDMNQCRLEWTGLGQHPGTTLRTWGREFPPLEWLDCEPLEGKGCNFTDHVFPTVPVWLLAQQVCVASENCVWFGLWPAARCSREDQGYVSGPLLLSQREESSSDEPVIKEKAQSNPRFKGFCVR